MQVPIDVHVRSVELIQLLQERDSRVGSRWCRDQHRNAGALNNRCRSLSMVGFVGPRGKQFPHDEWPSDVFEELTGPVLESRHMAEYNLAQDRDVDVGD